MSQQINLFNPALLKQEKPFSARMMAQALAVILLGSILVAGYAKYQTASLERDAAATEVQLNAAKAQLAKTGDAGPRQPDKALEEEIRSMEAELASQRQAFDILSSGKLGDMQGYAEYLRAFSRQIVRGIWLTGFVIQGDGAEIEMRGRAMKPELVPAYINRLKQEPVMKGKSFATLSIETPLVEAGEASRAEGAPAQKTRVQANYIEFTLRSSGLAAAPDAEAK